MKINKLLSKKVVLVTGFLIFLVSILTVAGCKKSPKAGKIGKIKAAGKLVVGTSADYPPYEFHLLGDKEAEIVGLDIDIANAIAKELGVELEVKEIVFHRLFDVLYSDEVDLVIAGLAPSERRKQAVDFSDIYYQAVQNMVIRSANENEIAYIKDLRGKRVGTQKGSIQDDMARKVILGAEFVEMENIIDLISSLKEEKIDAVILEKPVAESYVLRNEGLKSIECTLGAFDVQLGSAIAVKKGNTDLLNEINRILQKLKNENKIAEFVQDAMVLMMK